MLGAVAARLATWKPMSFASKSPTSWIGSGLIMCHSSLSKGKLGISSGMRCTADALVVIFIGSMQSS